MHWSEHGKNAEVGMHAMMLLKPDGPIQMIFKHVKTANTLLLKEPDTAS
jgi:hypothetical protein